MWTFRGDCGLSKTIIFEKTHRSLFVPVVKRCRDSRILPKIHFEKLTEQLFSNQIQKAAEIPPGTCSAAVSAEACESKQSRNRRLV
jgi:hypothetical protein